MNWRSEIVDLNPAVSDPERGVYCFFCNEEPTMVRPLVMEIEHAARLPVAPGEHAAWRVTAPGTGAPVTQRGERGAPVSNLIERPAGGRQSGLMKGGEPTMP